MPDVTDAQTGITITFPDGMSPDDIGKVMQTHPQIVAARGKALANASLANAAQGLNLPTMQNAQGQTVLPPAVKQLGTVEATRQTDPNAAYTATDQVAMARHLAAVKALNSANQKPLAQRPQIQQQAQRNLLPPAKLQAITSRAASDVDRTINTPLITRPMDIGLPEGAPGTFEQLQQMQGFSPGLARGLAGFTSPQGLAMATALGPLSSTATGGKALLAGFGALTAKGAYDRAAAGDPGGALGELAAFALPVAAAHAAGHFTAKGEATPAAVQDYQQSGGLQVQTPEQAQAFAKAVVQAGGDPPAVTKTTDGKITVWDPKTAQATKAAAAAKTPQEPLVRGNPDQRGNPAAKRAQAVPNEQVTQGQPKETFQPTHTAPNPQTGQPEGVTVNGGIGDTVKVQDATGAVRYVNKKFIEPLPSQAAPPVEAQPTPAPALQADTLQHLADMETQLRARFAAHQTPAETPAPAVPEPVQPAQMPPKAAAPYFTPEKIDSLRTAKPAPAEVSAPAPAEVAPAPVPKAAAPVQTPAEVAPPVQAPPVKEPWQMTKEEFVEPAGRLIAQRDAYWQQAKTDNPEIKYPAVGDFSHMPPDVAAKMRDYQQNIDAAWQKENILKQQVSDTEQARGNTIAHPSRVNLSAEVHQALITRALSEGKPVPPEVLADYPNLAEKAPPEAAQTPAEAVKPIAPEPAKGGSKLDSAEAAVKERITNRKIDFNSLGSGGGKAVSDIVEHLQDYAQLGAIKIARGAISAADFGKEMVQEFGDGITPHLSQIYEAAKAYHDEHLAPRFGLKKVNETAETVTPGVASQRPAQGGGAETTQAEPRPTLPRPKARVETSAETNDGLIKSKGANAHAAEQRKALGMEALPDAQYKPIAKAFEDATATNAKASAYPLAEALLKSPRNLSETETAGLVQRMQEVAERINSLRAETEAHVKAGDIPKAQETAALERDMLREHDVLDRARKVAGTEWARTGLARQVEINQYDYVGTRQRLVSANPARPVTPKEESRAADMTSRLTQAERVVNVEEKAAAPKTEEVKPPVREGKNSGQSDVQAKADAQKTLDRVARSTGRQVRVETIRADRQQIIADLKKVIGGQSLNAGPKQVVDSAVLLGKLAANYIHEGAVSLAEVVDKVHSDFPKFSAREIHDALSGYGRETEPKSKSEAMQRLADLRKEAMLTSKLADEQKGIDTRLDRNPYAPKDNAKAADLREQLTQHRQDRDTRAAIADIQQQLDSGNIRPTSQGKTPARSELEQTLADKRTEIAEARRPVNRLAQLKDKITREKAGEDTRTQRDEPNRSAEEQAAGKELADIRKAKDAPAREADRQARQAEAEARKLSEAPAKDAAKAADRQARLVEASQQREVKIQAKIDDIRQQLASGNLKPIEPGKPVTRSAKQQELLDARTALAREQRFQDAEAIAQKAQAKRLSGLQDKLTKEEAGIDTRKAQASRTQTPEEADLRDKIKLQQRMKDVSADMADLQEQIKTGNFKGATAKTSAPVDPQLQTLLDQRDALRKQAADPRKVEAVNKEIADLQEQLRTGNLKQAAAKPAPVVSPELKQARAVRDNLKAQIDQMIADRQKVTPLDYLARWHRFAILSGTPVLGKLSAAATGRIGLSPIEDMFGAGIGKIMPNLVKNAPREGGFNVKAEVDAFKGAFSKATLTDMRAKLTTGRHSLDDAAIARGDKHAEAHHPFWDFFGALHGALKTPAQRGEYFRALEKYGTFAAKQGRDLTNPQVQMEVAGQAYASSKRAILMGDNVATDIYQNFIHYAERQGATGKLIAGSARTLLPIVKVPTNFVSEASNYVAGGAIGMAKTLHYNSQLPRTLPQAKSGIAGASGSLVSRVTAEGNLASGLKKTLSRDVFKELTTEQSDTILRAFKKQGIGAGLIAMTFAGLIKAGGYYNGKKRENGLEPGEMQIGPVKISHSLAHTPAFESIQFAQTLMDTMEATQGQPLQDRVGHAGIASGLGLSKEVPFVSEVTRLGTAARNEGGLTRFGGDLAKSMVIPQLVQQGAKGTLPGQQRLPEALRGDTDVNGTTIKRKTQGFQGAFYEGLPFLRPTLPPK